MKYIVLLVTLISTNSLFARDILDVYKEREYSNCVSWCDSSNNGQFCRFGDPNDIQGCELRYQQEYIRCMNTCNAIRLDNQDYYYRK